MEYNMDTLNGIYKAYNQDLEKTYYIILFKDGKSANYIYHRTNTPPVYGTNSTFTNGWGKYTDAEPHEIASLEASMKARKLVIVGKKKEELSHISLIF